MHDTPLPLAVALALAIAKNRNSGPLRDSGKRKTALRRFFA
ncbi:hypothetical protein [uncultured Cardiobacterium sp.]|nr:hypothetical protein [uncultured Cardiobacterium sp.]